jgi:hypothetical protein
MNQFGKISPSHGQSRPAKETSQFDCQTLTTKFFELDRGAVASPSRALTGDPPHLVIFGGRDLLNQQAAERFCGFVTKELHTHSTPVTSAFYDGKILEDPQFNDTMIDFYQHGASSKLAQAAALVARSFIQERLLPMDLNLPQSIKAAERQEVVAQTADRFKKITLFGFSFGSIVLNAFDRELALELVGRGFSSEESARLRSHLAIITIGDVAFEGARSDTASAEWSIPAIHVASTRDIYAGPTLRAGSSYKPVKMNASYLSNGKRIAVTAPLRRLWYGINDRGEEKIKSDNTGHTPPVYLTSKVNIVSSSYSIFIPLMVRSIVHAMLDPLNRPCDPAALLNKLGAYSPVGDYYREYIDDLLKTHGKQELEERTWTQ